MEPILIARDPAPGPYIHRICQFTTHRQGNNTTVIYFLSYAYKADTNVKTATRSIPKSLMPSQIPTIYVPPSASGPTPYPCRSASS